MAEHFAGIEPGSLVEFTTVSGTVESTIVRSGNYSLKCTGGQIAEARAVFSAAENESVLRFGFRFGSAPSTNRDIVFIEEGTAIRARLYLNSSRQLVVLATGGTLQTGTTVLAVDTWYLLELRYKLGTGANAEAEVRIEGVTEKTCNNGTDQTGADGFYFLPHTEFGTCYFDDIRFTTVVWPGDGKIVALRPNGAGDSDTNYSGDYTDIDDDPINEATLRTCTAATGDFFDAIADVPGDFDSINVVQATVWTKGDDAANEQHIRYKNNGGGAQEYLIPDLPRAAFAYRTFIPGTQPTTAADINGAQIGMRHDDSKDGDVAEMWLMLDYSVSSGTPVSQIKAGYLKGRELLNQAKVVFLRGKELWNQTRTSYLLAHEDVTGSRAAFLDGLESLNQTLSGFLDALESLSQTQPGYLKGREAVEQAKVAYIRGREAVNQAKAAYLYATTLEQVSQAHTAFLLAHEAFQQAQTAYLLASEYFQQSQPGYLLGHEEIAEVQAAYLAVLEATSQGKPAYLDALETLSEALGAYLNGIVGLTATREVYLRGHEALNAVRAAYLRMHIEASGSKAAYLAALEPIARTQQAFLASIESLSSTKSAYLEAIQGIEAARACYLLVNEALEAAHASYLRAMEPTGESCPAFLLGSEGMTGVTPSFLLASESWDQGQEAYMLGHELIPGALPAYLLGEVTGGPGGGAPLWAQMLDHNRRH